MADVFDVNSVYRTRYLHVAVATSCLKGRADAPGPERQAMRS